MYCPIFQRFPANKGNAERSAPISNATVSSLASSPREFVLLGTNVSCILREHNRKDYASLRLIISPARTNEISDRAEKDFA
jgi:hypothetical protein